MRVEMLLTQMENRLKNYIDEKFAILDEKTKRRNSILYKHDCEECEKFFQCSALSDESCRGCESFIDGSCQGHESFPYGNDIAWKEEIRLIHEDITELKNDIETFLDRT